MKNFKKLILPVAAVLFIAVRLVVYKEPAVLSLSNSFFFLGLMSNLTGLACIVDILGLFKSFGYLLHRRKIKNENIQRKKDGEVPIPIPDLADYLESRDYVPVRVIITLLIVGVAFWVLSYALSLQAMKGM